MSDLIQAAVLEVAADMSQFEAQMARAGQLAKGFETAAVQAAGNGSAALSGVGKGADAGASTIDAATRRAIESLKRETAALTLNATEYKTWNAIRRGASEDVLAPYIRKLNEASRASEALAAAERKKASDDAFLDQLRRQADAIGKTRTQLLELEAAQRGLGSQAAPFLAKLNSETAKTATGLNLVGISAGQASNALRQLPAQFTDIFTSLQAGQPALTVFLQQGGQIRDTFGGFGNAFKAIGSLISPTVVALAGIGGALTAISLAYKQGSGEADAYARSLVLTGSASGKTVDQLTNMARAIDQNVGTQAKAAEVLAQLAGSGKIAGGALEQVAQAAIRLDQVGGQALEKTIDQFVSLGRDPVSAAKQLNEATNFLTLELYRQIKALQDAGKEAEASALAQTKYAEAVEGRAKELEGRLGSLERAWLGVKNVAKEAWDAMLNIGRPDTLEDQLKSVEEQLAGFRPNENRPLVVAEQGRLQQQAESLRLQIYGQQEAAAAAAARTESTKRGIKADEDAAAAAKKHASELEKLRQAGLDLINDAAGALYAERQAGELEKLTAAEKDALKAMEALRDGKVAMSDVDKQRLAAMLEERIANEDIRLGLEAVSNAYEREAAELAKLTEARRKAVSEAQKAFEDALKQETKPVDQRVESVQQRLQALRLEAEAAEVARAMNIGLASAIEIVTAKRLADTLASREEAPWITDRLNEELRLRKELAAQIESTALDKLADDLLDPARAQSFGDALTKAFDGAGSALAKMANTFSSFASKQEKLNKDFARNRDDQGNVKNLRLENALIEQQGQLQLDTYAQMAGAAKGFFDENTKGYKALEAAQTVFTAAQLASDLIRGISAAAVGVAHQATAGDVYTAIPRMAAMAAIMAGLGFATGFFGSSGGGGSATAAQRQGGAATGRIVTAADVGRIGGTVLGDDSARSESIANSIDALEDIARIELQYSSSMLRALENIDANMAGLASLVARSAGLTTGKNLGIFEGTIAENQGDALFRGTLIDESFRNAPILGNVVQSLQKLWGKTTQSIVDSGLSIMGRVSDLIDGVGVQQFADVATTTSSFFGLRKKTTTDTVFAPVEDQIATQFGLIFQNIGATLKDAAGALGADGGQIGDAVSNFFVDIARLSLKDLKGDDLKDAISAAIGSQADLIAATVLPGLSDFQQVGEGYFETLVRVAGGVEEANFELEKLGLSAINYADILQKQGDVSAEIVRQSILAAETAGGSLSGLGEIISTFSGSGGDIAEVYGTLLDIRTAMVAVGLSGADLDRTLIRSAGSIDALSSGLSDYLQGFFSDQEKFASEANRLSGEFAKLGLQLPQSREEFRTLIATLSASGSDALGSVLALAGGLSDLADSADSLNSKRNDLQLQILQLEGNETAALALQRKIELEAMRELGDEFVTLQQRIYDLTDAAAAAAKQARITEGFMRYPGGAATSISALSAGGSAITQASDMARLQAAFEAELVKEGSGWKRYVDEWWGGTIPGITRSALFNNFAIGEIQRDAVRLASDANNRGNNGLANFGQAGTDTRVAQLAADQLKATEDLIKSLDSVEEALQDQIDKLLTGSLSALSPEQQYLEARRQFESLVAQGFTGDTAAANQADDAAVTFLELAKSFNSEGGYTPIFNDVVAELRALKEFLASLNVTAKQNLQATAQSGVATVTALDVGNQLASQMASTQKQDRSASVA